MSDKSPENRGSDLSAGNLQPDQLAQANIGIKDQEHRHKLQRRAANVGIWIPAVLFLAAGVFASLILCAFLRGDVDLDWHVSLFVAAFVIPPTIILIAFMRAAYQSKTDHADAAPLLKFVKELVDIFKDAYKSIKGGGVSE